MYLLVGKKMYKNIFNIFIIYKHIVILDFYFEKLFTLKSFYIENFFIPFNTYIVLCLLNMIEVCRFIGEGLNSQTQFYLD